MTPRNRVYMDGPILMIDVIGDQTGETIQAMGEEIHAQIEHLRDEKIPVLILDNLTQIGTATARALQNVAILARLLDYDRAVMLDNRSALLKTTVNMILVSVGRSNARYSSDAAAATTWLLAYQEKS